MRYLPQMLMYPFVLLYVNFFPKKYAVPGVTRVKFNFHKLADELYYLQDEHNSWTEDTGVVVDQVYRYASPGFGHRERLGVYSTGNSLFPSSYIVRSDTSGELLDVPDEGLTFLSNYRIALPFFSSVKREDEFIRDLEEPLKAFPGDIVSLKTEKNSGCVECVIDHVVFTSTGRPRYSAKLAACLSFYESLSADPQKRAESVELDKEFRERYKKGFLADEDFDVVSRGNLYHLHNSGPEDLVFKNLDDEITFWKHQTGEWLSGGSDKKYRKVYSLQDAIDSIESGDTDMAADSVGNFTPIRILPYFERFCDRARLAGMKHLLQL